MTSVSDKPASRTYSTEVRVRYAEVDRMGVLHHSRYLVLMELARTEALREAGYSYRDLEDRGVFLVIVKVDVRYRRPAMYDDVLVLETTIERVTWTRIDHRYRILRKDDGEVLAEASTTLGCVGRDGQPRKLPEELLSLKDTGDTA